jgi:hypothetical protein
MVSIDDVAALLPRFKDPQSGFLEPILRTTLNRTFIERDYRVHGCDIVVVDKGSIKDFQFPKYSTPLDLTGQQRVLAAVQLFYEFKTGSKPPMRPLNTVDDNGIILGDALRAYFTPHKQYFCVAGLTGSSDLLLAKEFIELLPGIARSESAEH